MNQSLKSGIFLCLSGKDGLYLIGMDDLSEIIKRRSTPGILIFDTDNRLLYSNREALEMIPNLQNAAQAGEKNHILEEIYMLCNQVKSSPDADIDQKVHTNYKVIDHGVSLPLTLRAFLIERNRKDVQTTHTMILVERVTEKRAVDFEKVKKNFNLTKRELEVLRLICLGDTNKRIAGKLFITEYTVKDHIKKIMRKMGVDSRGWIIAAILR